MSAVCVYSYADANGLSKFVDENDYNYTGTWSSSGTYVASTLDVVTYATALYICIDNNVGDNPRRTPTRTNPTNWSILSLLYEYQCEDSGGSNAIALAAYDLAVTGTNIAWAAYYLAQIGTNTGSAAYDLAGSAYAVGTDAYALAGSVYALAGSAATDAALALSTANGAFTIAVAGTNAAASALATADAAYALAQIGTNTGTAAYELAQTGSNLAWDAYQLAVNGTTVPPLADLPDVSIPTPYAAQVLTYNGSVWIADYSQVESSHAGYTYYLDGPSTDFPGYEVLTTVPTGGTEVIESVAVTTAGGSILIDQYLSGTLGRNILNAGIWEYNTYASSNRQNCVVEIKTLVLSGTTETLLWSSTSPELLSTSVVSLVSSEVFGTEVAVQPSDRLLLRYYGKRNSGTGTATVSLYHNGLTHYTHVHTPLALFHNELAGLQGGDSGSNAFYHLTAEQHSQLGLPSAVAVAAYALAQIGTNTGTAALSAAASAQSTANSAFSVAVIGTNAAATAQSTANSAFSVAQIGTNTGSLAHAYAVPAWQLAQFGTNTGTAAYSYAAQAYTLAQTGTSIANAAYAIAVNGTTAIITEQGTRSQADQVLTTAIITEQGTRSLSVQSLQNQVTLLLIFDIQGFIEAPSDKDYKIVINSSFGFTINEITTRSTAGTVTLTGKINTTPLGGTANSVSTTETTQTHSSANTAVVGDDIVLTLSSNSSCANLSFKLKCTRILA